MRDPTLSNLRVVASILAVVTTCCGGRTSCPDPPPSTANSGGYATPTAADASTAPARSITLNFQGATVSAILLAVAAAGDQSLVVTPDAVALTNCATLSLFAPEPVSSGQATELVRQALVGSALRLIVQDNVLRIERVAAVDVPESCRPAPPVATAVSEPVEPPPLDRAGALALVLQGIRRVSSTEHTITGEAMDRLLENQAVLLGAMTVTPVLQHTQVVGLRLQGVVPGGVFDALGFQSGDVVVSLNGLDISSPEHALEAYARLRTAPELLVQVRRRAARITLRIRRVAG